MVLRDTCLAAREVSLDILYRNIRTGRNGNKNAMVSTRQGVLMTAAAAAVADVAASVAAADASAAADVARGAAKPTDTDTVRGATKLTASDDDDADGLCSRACREHCHGLRGSVGPRRRAPGRCLAALHL